MEENLYILRLLTLSLTQMSSRSAPGWHAISTYNLYSVNFFYVWFISLCSQYLGPYIIEW